MNVVRVVPLTRCEPDIDKLERFAFDAIRASDVEAFLVRIVSQQTEMKAIVADLHSLLVKRDS